MRMTDFKISRVADPRGYWPWRQAAAPIAPPPIIATSTGMAHSSPAPALAYLASIAVTSTSIAMWGHANWLTTRNVEAGIGALPKASARHFRAS